MTWAQYVGLASAALGAIGTIILFFSSYSVQPLEGGIFGSDYLSEHNDRIKIQNANRLFWQRIGLGFLCLGFIVQAIAVLGV